MILPRVPALVLAAALVIPAFTALPAKAEAALEPQSQNGISFISGGIGDEGRAALRQAMAGYNLRLMFALQGSGEYLSDIKVKLMNAQGRTLVDAVSDGPFFLAQVRPGAYRVIADDDGHPQTKTVTVTGKGPAVLSFYWPPPH